MTAKERNDLIEFVKWQRDNDIKLSDIPYEIVDTYIDSRAADVKIKMDKLNQFLSKDTSNY